MPLILFNDDRPARPGGRRFRLIVLPPSPVERLIGRLAGRLLRRLVGGA